MKTTRRMLSLLLTACLLLSCLSITAFAKTAPAGTPIYDEAGLKAIANDLDGTYYLANDIELGSWEPLGWTETSDEHFTGVFDGNGHTISGMNADYSEGGYVGLFAINSGTIRNLNMDNCYVYGWKAVGIIAGANLGVIENVHVSNSTAQGAQKSTSASALTNSATYIGVITGHCQETGSITYCSATTSYAEGVRFVGGISGGNFGTISRCWTLHTDVNRKMDVDAMTNNAAIVALNLGTNAYDQIGGLVGGNDGALENSYAVGADIQGWESYGCLVGKLYSGGTVKNCYVAESTTFGYTVYNYGYNTFYAEYISLTIGQNQGSYSGLYYTYSSNNNGFGTGYSSTSGAMKKQSTFSQYDFTDVWAIDATTNSGYPHLQNPYADDTVEYTVTFLDGKTVEGDIITGMPEPNPATVIEGDTITLTEPVRTNAQDWVYIFKGWECSDGNTYAANDVVTVTDDLTFTATWQLYSVNGDGTWNYRDSMALLDMLANKISFTEEQKDISDRDGNGTINYRDAMYILDVLSGKIENTSN